MSNELHSYIEFRMEDENGRDVGDRLRIEMGRSDDFQEELSSAIRNLLDGLAGIGSDMGTLGVLAECLEYENNDRTSVPFLLIALAYKLWTAEENFRDCVKVEVDFKKLCSLDEMTQDEQNTLERLQRLIKGQQ